MKNLKFLTTLNLCLTMVIGLTTGCDDSAATGTATVALEVEDVITQGIGAGSTVDDIQDGWDVQFTKYIAVVGEVDVHFATDMSLEVEDESTFAVDLTNVASNGLALATLADLQEGSWNINYHTAAASATTMRDMSVSEADMTEMQTNGWTYLIEGTLTQTGGQSCPPASLANPGSATANGMTTAVNMDPCYDNPTISFRIGAESDTLYGPCEVDGVPGFTVTAGSDTTLNITLHGDHLFFNGFPEGDEGGVTRLAQWLANSDLNLDGQVTVDELTMISPSDLDVIDSRYQLGGSPITPIDNMFTYVRAQFKTQGHFNGEGECPVDGVEHDHD